MAFLLTILTVFIVLIGCEFWWRRSDVDEEFSRKFIHITVGSFVAFWPLFLSWKQIELLSIAFLAVVILSKYLKLFEAIHSVQRPTWGELYFAAAVGLVAMITHDKWIYAAALLQMALADGLAAVIGTKYGGRHKYLVLGHTKSVVGTLTFLAVSLAILGIFNQHFVHPLNLAGLLITSLVASVIENFGVMGADNLLVPLFVALVLAHS